MPDDNQHYAYFSVTGDFDPAALTTRLGLPPTESWRRGDACPRTRRERQFSRWKLASRLDRGQELEAHACDVLAQLAERSEAFAAVSRE